VTQAFIARYCGVGCLDSNEICRVA